MFFCIFCVQILFFLVTFVCCFDCCLIACVQKLINRLATTGGATQSKKKWNSTKEVCNVPETVLHASSNCVVWCVASFGPRKGRARPTKINDTTPCCVHHCVSVFVNNLPCVFHAMHRRCVTCFSFQPLPLVWCCSFHWPFSHD